MFGDTLPQCLKTASLFLRLGEFQEEGDVESSCNGKKGLEERLNAHPLLRDRMEMLLRVVENADGDVEKADEAERLVIEEIGQMGSAALQSWAENQPKKKAEEFEKSKRGSRRRKENSVGTACLEKSK